MRKKGALELSINTIIIIVIGVALLSLGLIFVKNMFGQVGELSTNIFEGAKTSVGKINTGEKLSTPTKVNIKQGDTGIISILVGNDGRCKSNKFTLSVNPPWQKNDKVGAYVVQPNTQVIKPGEEKEFKVSVGATNDAVPSTGGLDTVKVVSVTLQCAGETDSYATSAFIINVEKGGGLLKGIFG